MDSNHQQHVRGSDFQVSNKRRCLAVARLYQALQLRSSEDACIQAQLEQCEQHVYQLASTLNEYLHMIVSIQLCLKHLATTRTTSRQQQQHVEWMTTWLLHFLRTDTCSSIHIYVARCTHDFDAAIIITSQDASGSDAVATNTRHTLKEEQALLLEQMAATNLNQVLTEQGHDDCDDSGFVFCPVCKYNKCRVLHKQDRGADEGGTVRAMCPKHGVFMA